MTYTVSSGTLNSSIPYHTIPDHTIPCTTVRDPLRTNLRVTMMRRRNKIEAIAEEHCGFVKGIATFVIRMLLDVLMCRKTY